VEADTISKSCLNMFKKDHVDRDEVGREGGAREGRREEGKCAASARKGSGREGGGREGRHFPASTKPSFVNFYLPLQVADDLLEQISKAELTKKYCTDISSRYVFPSLPTSLPLFFSHVELLTL